jgi:predicted LPLAT superfamily acyltransferase
VALPVFGQAPLDARLMTAQARWRDVREKGSMSGMLFTVFVYRLLGRWVVEAMLWWVVGYFFLKDGRLRRASYQYLSHVHGEPLRTRWSEAYRHCLSFARMSLDRFDVWTDRLKAYTFQYHGDEHLTRLKREGRGAILIGAHLGNFDMLRAMASHHNAKVHILLDSRNAQNFSALLKRFNPKMTTGVIEYDRGSVDTVFDLEKAIQRGEHVALLGDRIASESSRGASRVSPAPFLGGTAYFPQAPFLFAAHLKCPVFLMLGLRRSAQSYDLFVEPLAESVELPEDSRHEALDRYIAAYAARLEHYCRRYPLQWFNFYDFWRQPV